VPRYSSAAGKIANPYTIPSDEDATDVLRSLATEESFSCVLAGRSKEKVELVEQKSVKKITMADIRKMSAEQFQAALRDTDLAPQTEALLRIS